MGRLRRESKFEKDCIKKLRSLPNSFWPPKEAIATIVGLPDRVGCVNGRYISIEFKRSEREYRTTQTKTNIQEYTRREIERAGGLGLFCWPEIWEKTYQTIKEIACPKQEHSTRKKNVELR